MQVAKVEGIEKRIVYNTSKAYVLQVSGVEDSRAHLASRTMFGDESGRQPCSSRAPAPVAAPAPAAVSSCSRAAATERRFFMSSMTK